MQDITLHLVTTIPLALTVSQTLLVCDGVDSFEEHWSGILQNVPQLNLSDIFLMIRLGLWVWG